MTAKKTGNLDADIMALQATMEAIDYLADVFENENAKRGITKRQIADIIGRDHSFVTRILNGRQSNVNFGTIARILVALGHWPQLGSVPLEELTSKANFKLCDVPTYNYERSVRHLHKADSEVEAPVARSGATHRVTQSLHNA